MHLQIRHRTTFLYAGPAQESFNEVRLRPLDDANQQCQSFELRIAPATRAQDYCDFYGNCVHYFEIPGEHEELVIDAVSSVTTSAAAARAAIPEISCDELVRPGECEMVAEFCTGSPHVPLEVELWREAQDALAGGRAHVWSDVQRIGAHVYRIMDYKPRTTGIDTRASDALRLRKGVCQDFAHVMLGLCRSVKIPARYVSGYFFNETRRPGEIEASHAWVEAYVPSHGWVGWDPTHDRAPDERYVRVAVGRDYADIRPVNGSYRGAPARELQVEVTVRQAHPADHSLPA